MEIKTFLVEGMSCKNCKVHVENGIRNLPGINDVIVDIANGQVRVSANVIDIDQVKSAVEQSGYTFNGELSITPMNSEHWLG